MTVGYKMVRETFTTQVLLKPEELGIDVSYVERPVPLPRQQMAFRGPAGWRLAM